MPEPERNPWAEPVAFAAGSRLPEPLDFVTGRLGHLPLFAARQESGGVRAFLNVCRHRGVAVVQEEHGHRRSFTCPFHGWTYGGDGTLKGIPFRPGFDSVKRSERGLIEIPALEHEGLIWIVPVPRLGQKLDEIPDEIAAALADLALDMAVQEQAVGAEFDCGWKEAMEEALRTSPGLVNELGSNAVLAVDGANVTVSAFLPMSGQTQRAVGWTLTLGGAGGNIRSSQQLDEERR